MERRSPMSEAESQEKMVLWKLRCSATRQKSSNTRFLINGQGKENEDVEKFCIPLSTLHSRRSLSIVFWVISIHK